MRCNIYGNFLKGKKNLLIADLLSNELIDFQY